MRRSSAAPIALVLMLSALAVALVPIHPAAADPTSTNNLDGTSDVVWNFSNPANYTLSNVRVAGGLATLRPQVTWWNSTTAADFAGPDSATNVDYTTYPGDIVLSTTSGASTFLTVQPDPAAGLDAYLDRGSVTLNHGGDTTLIYDARGSTNRRPILRFSLASIPAGAVIDDAKLGLYMSAAAANPSPAELHAVTPTWAESQVTWNDRLTGTPWTTAGGDYDARVIRPSARSSTSGIGSSARQGSTSRRSAARVPSWRGNPFRGISPSAPTYRTNSTGRPSIRSGRGRTRLPRTMKARRRRGVCTSSRARASTWTAGPSRATSSRTKWSATSPRSRRSAAIRPSPARKRASWSC